MQSVSSRALSARSLFLEALAGAFAKRSTAYLTLLGVAVGIATLVSTAGVAQSSGQALLSQLAVISGNVVAVGPPAESQPGSSIALLEFENEAAAARITGVLAVGTYGAARDRNQLVGLYIQSVDIADRISVPVIGVSGQLDKATEAQLRGRWFNEIELRGIENVAIIGANVADSLHIGEVGTIIFVGDTPFTVIGILDRVEHETSLLAAILIPHGTAASRYGDVPVERIVALTKQGYAQDVAKQIATALNPQAAASLVVELPESFADVRSYAEGNVNAIYYLLGFISLVVAALGIGNAMTMSVLSRRSEIGLRIALGAARADIYRQFLLESSLIGFLGGLFGVGTGSFVVLLAAVANGWPPAAPGPTALAGPFLGALLGCVAGLMPARSASRLQPAEALRGGL